MATLRTALATALKTENPSTILEAAVLKNSKTFNNPPFACEEKHDKIRGKAKRLIFDTFGKETGKLIIDAMFTCNRTDSRDKQRYHNIQHVTNCLWLLDRYVSNDSFGVALYSKACMILAFVFHDAYHSQGRDADIINITKANSRVLSLSDWLFVAAAKVIDADPRKLTTDVMNIISDSQYPYPKGDVKNILSILFRIIDRANCVCPGWFTLIYKGLLAEIRVNNPSFTLYEFTCSQVKFITDLFDEVDNLDKALLLHRQGEEITFPVTQQLPELCALDSYYGLDMKIVLSDLAKAVEDMTTVHYMHCEHMDQLQHEESMASENNAAN